MSETAPEPAARATRAGALEPPTVLGLTLGRSLPYPADGDVESAVDTAVELL